MAHRAQGGRRGLTPGSGARLRPWIARGVPWAAVKVAVVLYGPKGAGKSWIAELLARRLVSVEATGAWDSDWQLADDLERGGTRVVSA